MLICVKQVEEISSSFVKNDKYQGLAWGGALAHACNLKKKKEKNNALFLSFYYLVFLLKFFIFFNYVYVVFKKLNGFSNAKYT